MSSLRVPKTSLAAEQLQRLIGIAGQLDDLETALKRASRADGATLRAARRLNRAAGTLAVSVLMDSAVQHYRGSFENRAMFTPLAVSALTLAISAHGTADKRPATHRIRQAVYSSAALTGIAGVGFHLYNVLKRPGAVTWQNLFYGAPLGAPAAILLSGLLGSAAEQVRGNPPERARVLGLPGGRLLAAISGIGMFATAAEAGLLHFRGAFHNPAMFAPVTIPPIAGAALLEAAIGPRGRGRWMTRWCMRLTALLGVIGSAFHVWGVQRNMGGWRNWRQTVLNGPPIPAPPSFTGLALAGLAALGLLEDHPDG
ncbi:MAG TPA: hypothetical protein VN702_12340 [Acetobacteraceae bacterium]|nr:hypothetical protein [Acetobacteraceae bacterium]